MPETATIEMDERICRAKVEKVDAFGLMDVRFSTFMKTQFLNITWLNDTIIDIYVTPSG